MKSFINKNHIPIFILMVLFTFLSASSLVQTGAEWDSIFYSLFTLDLLGKPDIPAYSYQMIFGIFPSDFHYTAHCFAMPAYLVIPFLLVLGLNIFALKSLGLILTVLTIYILYRLILYYFDYSTALLTSALLCISPQFIHYSKTVLRHVEFNINFLFYTALLLIALYMKKNKSFFLYTAAFLVGLGFSTKMSIVARIFGISTAVIFIYPRELVRIFRFKYLKKAIITLLFFAAGSSLFIYYNVATLGESIKLIKYDKESTAGIHYVYFDKKVKLRFRQLKNLISEKIFGVSRTYNILFNSSPNNVGQNFLWFLFWLSFIFKLIYAFLIEKDISKRKRILFIYIFFITMYITCHFSPNSYEAYHLGFIYPFVQFLYAVFLLNIFKLFKTMPINNIYKSRAAYLTLFLLIISITSINLHTYLNYHWFLHKVGTDGLYSKSFEQCAEFITQNNISPIAMDSRFVPFYISGFYLDSCRPPQIINIDEVFKNNSLKKFYFIRSFETRIVELNMMKKLSAYAERNNLNFKIIKSFQDSLGNEDFFIYTME